MKKIVLIGMMILSSLLLWGQKNDKVCLSGSVTGFIETPVSITVIFKPETKAAEALKENVIKIIETFKEAAAEDNGIKFSREP